MYAKLFAGLHSDPARHLQKCFEDSSRAGLVREISFNSLCEHHLLPSGEWPMWLPAQWANRRSEQARESF
ncbi:MAG: hypothetical protein Ct9H300mP1_28870 [Planctomycetaceae bacterium]|nr:MAG: hypothetical protein Ct9H300mP1_28870 [Planctomycetaceae bacterium]